LTKPSTPRIIHTSQHQGKQKMTNNQLALGAALIAAIINFVLYGDLLAAVLGAGTITYVMSRILSWGIDKFESWKRK